MAKKEEKRILVVGSHSHPLATQTVSWGDEFYVGEYDAVIFSLPDLDSTAHERILNRDESYFSTIRKHIVDLQEQSGFPVYCIMDKMLIRSSYNKDLGQTNYGWSPVVPVLEEVPGKEIDKASSKLPEKYLKKVTAWIGFWNAFLNNTGYSESENRNGKIRFRYRMSSLLKNRAGKDIAFEVHWMMKDERNYSSYNEVLVSARSPITFLPKTENVREGIDALLASLVVKLEEEVPPPWVDEAPIFGEDTLLQNIGEATVQMEAAQKVISEKTVELAELRRFKKLLFAQGDELHAIVEEAFKLLGLNVKRGAVANKEDLIFEEDGQTIPMEIRGKDTSALNEGDVRQVISRQQEKNDKEKYKARGVFVLNHYRLTKPAERSKPFEPNIVKDLATPWGVCLVTTSTIFDLVDAKLQGADTSSFKDDLLNTVGIYSFTKKDPETIKSANKIDHEA